MQFGVRNRPEMMPGELGYAWVPIAMAAAQEMSKKKGNGASSTEQNPGMPGTEPSSPRQPSAVTTVSPTIQAQISPQISPVMTQQQSSPGATVGANPMQYMPGGMKGSGGGSGVSPYGNYAAPGMPSGPPGAYPGGGSGFQPQAPYTLDPMTGQYVPVNYSQSYTQPGGGQYSPVSVGGSRMTDIPWIPIAVVSAVAVGAGFLMRKKRARK